MSKCPTHSYQTQRHTYIHKHKNTQTYHDTRCQTCSDGGLGGGEGGRLKDCNTIGTGKLPIDRLLPWGQDLLGFQSLPVTVSRRADIKQICNMISYLHISQDTCVHHMHIYLNCYTVRFIAPMAMFIFSPVSWHS